MTREELRTKAIWTLASTNFDFQKPANARSFAQMPTFIRELLIEKMTVAFGALGEAGFPVLGDITSEMMQANSELPHNSSLATRFKTMLEAGDLTRKL